MEFFNICATCARVACSWEAEPPAAAAAHNAPAGGPANSLGVPRLARHIRKVQQVIRSRLAQQRKELDKAERRMDELNLLFCKLYEDMALGRLSNEQFALLTSGYEDEKAALTKRAAELRQEIDTVAERGADVIGGSTNIDVVYIFFKDC